MRHGRWVVTRVELERERGARVPCVALACVAGVCCACVARAVCCAASGCGDT